MLKAAGGNKLFPGRDIDVIQQAFASCRLVPCRRGLREPRHRPGHHRRHRSPPGRPRRDRRHRAQARGERAGRPRRRHRDFRSGNREPRHHQRRKDRRDCAWLQCRPRIERLGRAAHASRHRLVLDLDRYRAVGRRCRRRFVLRAGPRHQRRLLRPRTGRSAQGAAGAVLRQERDGRRDFDHHQGSGQRA